jgi:glyoxylase-like metal-dependent hydrolase (beta-lactamase superfamily II)
MAEKLSPSAPGVYALSGAVNQYILDDPQGSVTLIDAGLPGSTRRVLQLLDKIGRAAQDIQHILITHADIDHVGDLKVLVKATGARVIASALSQTYIQRRQTPPHMPVPYKYLAGTIASLLMKPAPVDQTVNDQDQLDIAGGIQVIATPGHTPDHVSYFWIRERVLFVGDLLQNMGKLKLMPNMITHDKQAARASARRVLALDPAFICPGHGQVWSAEQAPEQRDRLRDSLLGDE